MKIIIENLKTVWDFNDISFDYVRRVSGDWKLGLLCNQFEEFTPRHEGGL